VSESFIGCSVSASVIMVTAWEMGDANWNGETQRDGECLMSFLAGRSSETFRREVTENVGREVFLEVLIELIGRIIVVTADFRLDWNIAGLR
jgi:hypothetical protein